MKFPCVVEYNVDRSLLLADYVFPLLNIIIITELYMSFYLACIEQSNSH